MNKFFPDRPTIQLDFIRNYALKNYEKGWDGWIECLDDKDRYKIIGINTTPRAFVLAQAWVAGWTEAEANRAEACGLYDTGEDKDVERFEQLQENWRLQYSIATFYKDANKMQDNVADMMHRLLDKERESIDVK